MLNKQRKFILREHLFEGRAYTCDTTLIWDNVENSWMIHGRGNLSVGNYKCPLSETQALSQVSLWHHLAPHHNPLVFIVEKA